MRKVNYDLFLNNDQYVCSTTDYEVAQKWKDHGCTYRTTLEDIIPEVSKSEQEYRKAHILKENAIRKKRLAALG